MALQSITNINVDFYDKKYILINAKQLDRESRFLSITCYNHGNIYPINTDEHSAYIRYKKPDGYSVFNFCNINDEGKIIVELTEQMLAVDGICIADLVIVNKGKAEVNPNTGEIIAVNGDAILSSMLLHIEVTESAVANSEIESSYEYSAFNQTLKDYWGNFEDVMKTSKSWAVGGTGIEGREDEEFNNSMYWASEAQKSQEASALSEESAAKSASAASDSEEKSLEYKKAAETAKSEAQASQSAAAISETNAANSAKAAANSETNSALSETNAKASEDNALSYKKTVENINSSIVNSINTLASNGNIGSFIFMGAITFEELALLPNDRKAMGYTYCITNDFITDNSFVNGAGLSYTAGTNVYYVLGEEDNGKWNCLGGSASSTATVDEVREYLSI